MSGHETTGGRRYFCPDCGEPCDGKQYHTEDARRIVWALCSECRPGRADTVSYMKSSEGARLTRGFRLMHGDE
jgi:hypothetical protein